MPSCISSILQSIEINYEIFELQVEPCDLTATWQYGIPVSMNKRDVLLTVVVVSQLHKVSCHSEGSSQRRTARRPHMALANRERRKGFPSRHFSFSIQYGVLIRPPLSRDLSLLQSRAFLHRDWLISAGSQLRDSLGMAITMT